MYHLQYVQGRKGSCKSIPYCRCFLLGKNMYSGIEIPYLGDDDISSETSPDSLATWVLLTDRIPLLLALSLYGQPRERLDGFVLVTNYGRVCSWRDMERNIIVIGCKGTSRGTLKSDLSDDLVILKDTSYCNLGIVELASKCLEETLLEIENSVQDDLVTGRLRNVNEEPVLIFAGHSLGGTAAMCLTLKYSGSRGISFNGGVRVKINKLGCSYESDIDWPRSDKFYSLSYCR